MKRNVMLSLTAVAPLAAFLARMSSGSAEASGSVIASAEAKTMPPRRPIRRVINAFEHGFHPVND